MISLEVRFVSCSFRLKSPVSAGLFSLNSLETDSRAFAFRSFPVRYLYQGVSFFPLDLDGQYTSLVKMGDLLPGEGELGNQVLSHPISPLKNDAVVRIL